MKNTSAVFNPKGELIGKYTKVLNWKTNQYTRRLISQRVKVWGTIVWKYTKVKAYGNKQCNTHIYELIRNKKCSNEFTSKKKYQGKCLEFKLFKLKIRK